MQMSMLCLPGAVVDPFRDLASSCGVPDAVADVLQQAGWNVTLFSCWVASAAEVSTEVAKLGLPADLEDTPLLIASLRALWKACLAASETKGPAPTGVATSASVSSSWADNFPPRMPADELQQLKLAFSSKYPSEILDSDSMPGPRMLALLKKNSSVDWRFVPWKYRLSCKMHDERELATRPKKVARMEFQDLLLDEVPTREFGHTMGMFMLQSILHLHSVGVALLGLAHLVTLKEYDRAFLQKASAKYPASSGLRAPNSVELEWADKQLWGEIASLLEKGWTFDDSVHEVVHVRSSIQSYLQPRPVAASVPPAPFRQGGQGKADWGAGKSSWSWSRR